MDFDRTASAAYLANLLAKAASRALQARADGAGFAPGQLPVLLELWNGDGLTQRELLDRLDIEQATMANTLARMQRDGLISRRRHPSDRRAQLVFLTQRGKALRDTAMTAASQTEDALFQGFRRFERELLLEYMRMLLANLGRDPRV
ncbi:MULTISPECIES: MarR family winged helix-turn-helix transcriptional regulator [Shinella]|jgi:DNA-binding MarR family transcriptional regulator|uniref:MarR family transcriptional regulator n=1 Tax=Shinella sedimenti TaxID=2919913 RepID=A0ABT0CKU0_9HYPH|nr:MULTISPECIES: MarR family transcriptional regulator [Shinella]MCJ8149218.1 MarR family transcriptional regulator [Shinella sedimenti]